MRRPLPEREAKASLSGWRRHGHEIIFESDTFAGKAFDIGLIAVILASVGVIMAQSMAFDAPTQSWLRRVEWAFTGLFTVEYALRLLCVGRPLRYATSFFGVIDLLAIVPTYVSLFLPGAQVLLVIRIVRILRIFRVLKLAAYLDQGELLLRALRASRHKIIVFLLSVLTLVIFLGSLMYLIEGEENGFTSIPRSIYWAIVTMTTVGYGDISPKTPLGQALAALVMVVGYGIIAVPTGIVSAELALRRRSISGKACEACALEGHDEDALYCKSCGAKL